MPVWGNSVSHHARFPELRTRLSLPRLPCRVKQMAKQNTIWVQSGGNTKMMSIITVGLTGACLVIAVPCLVKVGRILARIETKVDALLNGGH